MNVRFAGSAVAIPGGGFKNRFVNAASTNVRRVLYLGLGSLHPAVCR